MWCGRLLWCPRSRGLDGRRQLRRAALPAEARSVLEGVAAGAADLRHRRGGRHRWSFDARYRLGCLCAAGGTEPGVGGQLRTARGACRWSRGMRERHWSRAGTAGGTEARSKFDQGAAGLARRRWLLACTTRGAECRALGDQCPTRRTGDRCRSHAFPPGRFPGGFCGPGTTMPCALAYRDVRLAPNWMPSGAE